MKLSRTRRFLALLLAVCAAVGLSACTPGGGIKVGPFPVSLDLGAGTISPEALGLPAGTKGTATVEYPLCELPTEEEIDALLAENVESNFAELVHVAEILVQDVTLQATNGDFSGLTQITVLYLPKPFLGVPRLPVLLGSASAAEGFDVEVNLAPEDEVDLLEFVRDNDSNPTPGCPTLLVVLTGEVPEDSIDWQGLIMADVYGEIRF